MDLPVDNLADSKSADYIIEASEERRAELQQP
jgi:hypothetical protein